MRTIYLHLSLLLGTFNIAVSQTELHLEVYRSSDLGGFYGQVNCENNLPESLIGMSAYNLYIKTNGDLIKPFQVWGDETNLLEFIPYGIVENNALTSALQCSEVGEDNGWGFPVEWLADTYIAMGGSLDGGSSFGLTVGCSTIGFDNLLFQYPGNNTVEAFLDLPASTVLSNPSQYPLGQRMSSSEGTITLSNPNALFSSIQGHTFYLGQYITNGPMVVKLNFSYYLSGSLHHHHWVWDPGLVISFGYCYDQNACNYSPDFEIVGTGYEFCEYNSCTPCGGCMDEAATNYNEYAQIDNGTCFFPNCTNPDALNYDPIAYEENGSCIFENSTCENAYAIISGADPVLVGLNEGGDAAQAMYCWMEEESAEIVWFSFEATNDDMFVLSEPQSGGLLDVVVLDSCDGAILSCTENGDLFYSALQELVIGQSYYIGLRGEAGEVFELSVGDGLVGCTNSNSINYLPAADINFGCEFSGCTDPQACNYMNNANVDDGSCIFSGAVLSGYVYRDFDLDNFPDLIERVPNYPLIVLPGNDLIYTNALGKYYYVTEDDGPYTIISDQSIGQYDPEFTETTIEDEGVCTVEQTHIRLISLNEGPSFFCQGYPAFETVICGGDSYFNFSVSNDGDIPIAAEVVVTIIPGSIFDFEQIPNGAEQLSNNQFAVSVPLSPGQSNNLNSVVSVNSVATSNIFISYDVTILDPNDEVIANELIIVPAEFLCSFDPNDKQAIPEGYAEPEFIHNERINYLINFQNTGNYQAVDIIVEDTLDLNVLDISTFQLVESSHAHYTTLSEDGLLQFFFENINLPDSTADLEGSQGFVSFSIEPFEDLPHGTVISNEALIYFDINDPITTNTTSRTIYYCGTEADVSTIPEYLCADEILEVSFINTYLDSTVWSIDGEIVGLESSLSIPLSSAGSVLLEWTGMNPLCMASGSAEILLEAYPEVYVNQETGAITTNSEGFYQWYDVNGPIPDANGSEFLPTEDGNYYLILTSSNGCEYQSESFSIVSADELEPKKFLIYPNPSSGILNYQSHGGQINGLQIMDLRGILLRSEQSASLNGSIDVSSLVDGIYLINIHWEDGSLSSKRFELIR